MDNVKAIKEYFDISEERAKAEYLKAISNLQELTKILQELKNRNKNLLEACQLLGGHNFQEDLFDLNFNNLLVTIHEDFTISKEVEVYIDSISNTPVELEIIL